MEKTKIIKNLFWIIGIASLIILLYMRLQESITRNFGSDEYHHLHYAWLLQKGAVPFRDFFNFYSPVFPLTLAPVFKIIGDSYFALTLSRIVIFIYFLITLVFTYKITQILTNSYAALISILVAASLPMSIEKAIEVRPDNLMIPLCLGGIYFTQRCIKSEDKYNFILAGVLFAVSLLVMIKIIFTIIAFILSLMILSFFDHNMRKKLYMNGHLTVIAFFSTLIVSLIPFTLMGILPIALNSIFIYSHDVVSSLRFGTELHPLYWFNPISSIYGTYKGLPWYVNFFIFALSILGVLSTVVRTYRNKSFVCPSYSGLQAAGAAKQIRGEYTETNRSFFSTYRWLLFLPAVASFLYLYMVLRPFHQYLLPFLAFIPFWCTFGLIDIEYYLHQKKLLVPLSSLISIILVLSMWQSWQPKKYWSDENDRKLINFILTNTKTTDIFWGSDPYYIFRYDGYPNIKLAETPLSLQKILPPIIPTLEGRKTSYLILPTSAVIEKTWPFDQPETQDLDDWIMKNYQETNYSGIWVRKTPFKS